MKEKSHILSDDFEDETQVSTFGIFSILPDFKLSYHLNVELSLNLTLEEDPYTLKNRNHLFYYNLFSFNDYESNLHWFFIGNQPYRGTATGESQPQLSIFEDERNMRRPLLKKESKINYFFQVYGDLSLEELKMLKNKIKSISGVQGLVEILPSEYKEGQNLYLNNL